MERLRPWLEAANPGSASLAPLAVAVGSSYAHFDARPGSGPLAWVLTLAAAWAAGMGINLVDHAWDAPWLTPGAAEAPSPEPSRPLDTRESALGAAGCLLAAAVLAFGLASIAGGAVLGYGLLAVLLGIWRRAPAVGGDTLGFGLGDLATVVALGPLAVIAGFASQAGEASVGALYVGVPVGLTAAAGLYLRHFTRRGPDTSLRRMTPVATLGDQQARLGAIALPLVAAAAILLAQRAGEYTSGARIACLPMIGVAVAAAWRLRGEVAESVYSRLESVGVAGVAAAQIVIVITFWWRSPV